MHRIWWCTAGGDTSMTNPADAPILLMLILRRCTKNWWSDWSHWRSVVADEWCVVPLPVTSYVAGTPWRGAQVRMSQCLTFLAGNSQTFSRTFFPSSPHLRLQSLRGWGVNSKAAETWTKIRSSLKSLNSWYCPIMWNLFFYESWNKSKTTFLHRAFGNVIVSEKSLISSRLGEQQSNLSSR